MIVSHVRSCCQFARQSVCQSISIVIKYQCEVNKVAQLSENALSLLLYFLTEMNPDDYLCDSEVLVALITSIT